MEFIKNNLGEIFAFGTAVSWSLAVICFRLAGSKISSLSFNFFKSAVTVVLFALLIAIRGGPWIVELSNTEWILIILSSFFGITLGDWFYLISLKRIGASFAAVVSCLYSPLMIFFAWVFLTEIPAFSAVIGSLFIVAAVLIGYFESNELKLSKKGWGVGVFFGILTEASMIIAIVTIRDLFRREDIVWVMGVRFLIGTLLSIPFFLMIKGALKDLGKYIKNPIEMKWVWIGTFLGPFLASIFWFLGFKYTDVASAAVLNQTSTVMIFILAAYFLKEPLGKRRILAVITAFFGVLMVTLFS
jgi:drug/metabolite transporter (DMT)-like permease